MSRESGLTLVEVLIASAIVVIIVGLAYPGFKTANDTMATSSRQDRLERQGDRALRLLTEELRSGWITGLTAAGQPPAVTIRSVQGEVDLADLEADGDVPWETAEKTIRFTQVDTLTEEDAGTDVNRDGDLSDSFALGALERVETVDGEPVVTRITGPSSQVVLALPSFAGDLNGDGVGDPLFSVDGRVLDISVRHLTRTESGQLLQTVTRGRTKLRNPQE
jgi:prepilin-type N-terminal cleavage/methylation domain-containing protein